LEIGDQAAAVRVVTLSHFRPQLFPTRTEQHTELEWGQQLYIKVHPHGVKESVSRAFERHKRIYEMAHEKRFYESFLCSGAHRKYLFNLLPLLSAACVQRGWFWDREF